MGYYKPCKEFEQCNRLIEEYFKTGQYEKCFAGHLALAEAGYPLAECQGGYFYYEGLDVEKDRTRRLPGRSAPPSTAAGTPSATWPNSTRKASGRRPAWIGQSTGTSRRRPRATPWRWTNAGR